MSTLEITRVMMDMSRYTNNLCAFRKLFTSSQTVCLLQLLLLLGVAGFIIVGPILRVTIKSNNQFQYKNNTNTKKDTSYHRDETASKIVSVIGFTIEALNATKMRSENTYFYSPRQVQQPPLLRW
uniref:Uncharacterized protein n=1 Tax=Glossina palpalis gambiensis TaxID=67801 RepID=A0A1B0ARE9_9MUSC